MSLFYMRTNRNCPRRNVDSQRICDYLVANGWTFAEDIPSASLIVVCTRAATEEFSGDARKYIVDRVREACGPRMRVRLELKPTLETTRSGRHRFVISRIGFRDMSEGG